MISEATIHESPHAAEVWRTRATGLVSSSTWGYGTARRTGSNGASLLLPGQVSAHGADRLSFGRSDGTCRGYSSAWYRHDLGCRHSDLGRQPDCRGARLGNSNVSIHVRNALSDTAFHRPWHLDSRLPAFESSIGSIAIHQRGNLDTRDYRQAPAPLFVDQRVEGAGGARRTTGGYRVDPCRLVLLRGSGAVLGADHRPGLLPAYWGPGALVVSTHSQTRRQAKGRLAVRPAPPVPQVGKHGPLFGFCRRPAGIGCPAVDARLSPGTRPFLFFNGAARIQAGAVDGTWIFSGKAVSSVVLSGATGLVLSGARLSCYRAHLLLCRPRRAWPRARLNLTNLKALTCYWGTAHLWTDTDQKESAGGVWS